MAGKASGMHHQQPHPQSLWPQHCGMMPVKLPARLADPRKGLAQPCTGCGVGMVSGNFKSRLAAKINQRILVAAEAQPGHATRPHDVLDGEEPAASNHQHDSTSHQCEGWLRVPYPTPYTTWKTGQPIHPARESAARQRKEANGMSVTTGPAAPPAGAPRAPAASAAIPARKPPPGIPSPTRISRAEADPILSDA